MTVYYTVIVNTKHKGSLAVAKCISKLYSLGHEVLLPIGDRKQYDVVFDNGKHLYKVQVKYAGLAKNGKYKAGLRVAGGNQSRNYVKKYDIDSFDYLYVYTADNRSYLINWTEISIRNEITIDDSKYLKYKV